MSKDKSDWDWYRYASDMGRLQPFPKEEVMGHQTGFVYNIITETVYIKLVSQ